MIERHKSQEYYCGCRDAVSAYAIWQNGEQRVGSGVLSLRDAMKQINTFADEAAEAEYQAHLQAERERAERQGGFDRPSAFDTHGGGE
jgi:hypothetical protein